MVQPCRTAGSWEAFELVWPRTVRNDGHDFVVHICWWECKQLLLLTVKAWSNESIIRTWNSFRMPSLGQVDVLSDDEGHTKSNNEAVPRVRQRGPSSLRLPARSRIFRVKVGVAHVGKHDPRHLANLIRSKCGCKSECFQAFRSHEHQLQEWMTLRKNIAKLSKLEHDKYVRLSNVFQFFMDLYILVQVYYTYLYIQFIVLTQKGSSNSTQVYKILQAQDSTPCRGSRHLRLMGKLVCNKGFMKLMGIGKYRFNTLYTASKNGEEYCPYDGRFVVREPQPPSSTWEKVHTFLTRLHLEIAEPIPDGLNSNKRPRHGLKKRDSPDLNKENIKHLPHGSISDYWRQCLAAYPGVKISRKLFCTDTQMYFNLTFHVWLYFYWMICCECL